MKANKKIKAPLLGSMTTQAHKTQAEVALRKWGKTLWSDSSLFPENKYSGPHSLPKARVKDINNALLHVTNFKLVRPDILHRRFVYIFWDPHDRNYTLGQLEVSWLYCVCYPELWTEHNEYIQQVKGLSNQLDSESRITSGNDFQLSIAPPPIAPSVPLATKSPPIVMIYDEVITTYLGS